MLDPALLMVKDRFTGLAQLNPSTDEPAVLKEANATVIFAKECVPPLERVPSRLEPTIRIPAESDEGIIPAENRTAPRSNAMWVYTNKRDLRINFDVTKAGPSGIKAVELWARHGDAIEASQPIMQVEARMSNIHAMPYRCIDRMEGGAPPFAAHLGSEGNYQFRMVFESGAGIKSPMPKNGDEPELYVCLDTTKPEVQMLSPVFESVGTVKLRWEASDKNFDEMPIRPEYSLDNINWTPVTEEGSWLPNTGEYRWQLPVGVPFEVHLRVVARDKAGNIGESHMPSKVLIDLAAPEGRISGVIEGLPEPRMVSPDSH